MARIQERRRAIELRLAGHAYSSIKDILQVNKSTLSGWLKNVPLSQEQLETIGKNGSAKRVESYIKTAREKRERIDREYYLDQKSKLLPISERDYFIAGLFLYLGEGAKSTRSRIQITNSDPTIIKFSLFWIVGILGIDKRKVRVQLHLYSDMDIGAEIKFWQNITTLQKDQFIKPYIKKGSSQKIDHPSFGHGTCAIYCHDAKIKDEIMAGMKVITDSVMRL